MQGVRGRVGEVGPSRTEGRVVRGRLTGSSGTEGRGPVPFTHRTRDRCVDPGLVKQGDDGDY